MTKIAILKETKNPPDKRVAITPCVAKQISEQFQNVELLVQSSDIRCFADQEYTQQGIKVQENVEDADILIGVKEVKAYTLLDNKTYLFFSHVAKKQPYNRNLLQTVLQKKITLIDYEYLLNPKNVRVVAFGHWAGIVGAYNALKMLGIKTKQFALPAASDLKDLAELKQTVGTLRLLPTKILITGEGRVASGALEILSLLNLPKVSAYDFLHKTFDHAVVCQIGPQDYVKRKDGNDFDLVHFFAFPEMYESTFLPFTKAAELYIPCHFWDNRSPRFITQTDMQAPDFSIKAIADVSCDLQVPIASSIKASTIAEPFYDYNPATGLEEKAFSSDKNVSVMAVDNLPGSLPRDASVDFASALLKEVFPALFNSIDTDMIRNATIAKNGKLTERFAYLQDYVENKH